MMHSRDRRRTTIRAVTRPPRTALLIVLTLLPAMGYGEQQVKDLEATIRRAVGDGVEAVAIGTPIDLARLVRIPVPFTRVRYELQALGSPTLDDVLAPILRTGRLPADDLAGV